MIFWKNSKQPFTSASLSSSPSWHLSQTLINIRDADTMPTWGDSQTAFTKIYLPNLLARYPRYPWYHRQIRAAHEKTFFSVHLLTISYPIYLDIHSVQASDTNWWSFRTWDSPFWKHLFTCIHQVDGYDRGAEVPEGGHGGDRHVRHFDSTNCRWLHYAIHEHWGEDR